ncbi:hypothetical protein BKA56DRAFT_610189 [Ilyonectria sp. MPI-CAGE-AT-0026]|nr:hypothetical protein BKA56DRAFT_610189 [Ilyonectria sp. MPI-CAGE-AT-0026]
MDAPTRLGQQRVKGAIQVRTGAVSQPSGSSVEKGMRAEALIHLHCAGFPTGHPQGIHRASTQCRPLHFSQPVRSSACQGASPELNSIRDRALQGGVRRARALQQPARGRRRPRDRLTATDSAGWAAERTPKPGRAPGGSAITCFTLPDRERDLGDGEPLRDSFYAVGSLGLGEGMAWDCIDIGFTLSSRAWPRHGLGTAGHGAVQHISAAQYRSRAPLLARTAMRITTTPKAKKEKETQKPDLTTREIQGPIPAVHRYVPEVVPVPHTQTHEAIASRRPSMMNLHIFGPSKPTTNASSSHHGKDEHDPIAKGVNPNVPIEFGCCLAHASAAKRAPPHVCLWDGRGEFKLPCSVPCYECRAVDLFRVLFMIVSLNIVHTYAAHWEPGSQQISR